MIYLDDDRKHALDQTVNGIAKIICINIKRDIDLSPRAAYFSGMIAMSALVAVFEAVDPEKMELGDTFTYDDIVRILNDTSAGQSLRRRYGFKFATGKRLRILDPDDSPSLLIVRCK